MAHQATLTWNASVDVVDGYNVYKGTTPGGEGAVAINTGLVTALTYVDTAVQVGVRYSYFVKAVKNGIESVASNEATTTVILPAAPTGLAVTVN